MTNRIAVVIAAAGRGERFGGSLPKALEVVAGKPLLEHTLRTVGGLHDVALIVVSAPQGFLSKTEAICERSGVGAVVVMGGDSRNISVQNAVSTLPESIGYVLVHDAARAFAPLAVFGRVISALREGHVAVIPGVPVTDTIKRLDRDRIVVETIDRSTLCAVQTPQGFTRELLVRAHRQGRELTVTDDAGLVEALGLKVMVVDGHPHAIKVTTQLDVVIAEEIVGTRGRGQ